jgi:thiol-disulfide isomerase/thioredoxin
MNDSTVDHHAPVIIPENAIGLAVASLVLGILAVALSLFVIGAVWGLVGLILGIVHLRRNTSGRGMACWGIGLSCFGMVFGGIVFGAVYYVVFSQMREMMDSFRDTDADLAQWEGVQAPDFSVTTLDGQTLTLSQLKGKRVVVDMWATWCPPCRKEIPHFIQLAKDVSPEDLVIIGISDEDHEVISEFGKKNEVNYPLASTEDLPAPYGEVSSIPTTFFIDRNGVIQSVMAGYHDYDTLRAAATAPDYAGAPKEKAEVEPRELFPAENPLTPMAAWSLPLDTAQAVCAGDWDGDGVDEILVADPTPTLHVIGRDGQKKESISLPGAFAMFELGRHRESGPRLLGFEGAGGRKIVVVGRDGKELWSYGSLLGVDGAHWGDLDGDGADEMVVGMNGFGGLHAVSADGKKLWKKGLGNVWNQAVVSAQGDHPAFVFATEASGTIRVFDAQGNPIRTLRPSGRYYSQMTAAAMDSSGAIQIMAIGKGMQGEDDSRVIVCDETGSVAWTATCQESMTAWTSVNFASGDVNGDGIREWVYRESDASLIVASAQGDGLCTLPVPERIEGFAVAAEPSGKGLVAVLKGNHALTAYRLE